MNDSLEPLYERLAARAMAKAAQPPVKPSAARRFKAKPYVRRAPAHKTHCLRGHERTDDNVGSSGGCRICQSERNKRKEVKAI